MPSGYPLYMGCCSYGSGMSSPNMDCSCNSTGGGTGTMGAATFVPLLNQLALIPYPQ